jgi:diacylglycerol O-acyltransferase
VRDAIAANDDRVAGARDLNVAEEVREALTAGDLNWWRGDQPRARTTMAMLMLLDRSPDWERLRAAMLHTTGIVPRLRQRIVDAPFGLALPRWETDPTFDLSYHLRRYSLHFDVAAGSTLNALFRTLGPIYERPFDRTRPLWELIVLDLPDEKAGIFFRLHHSIADGVGANAILAAVTDATRDGDLRPPVTEQPPGTWPEPNFRGRLVRALGDAVSDQVRRAQGIGGLLSDVAREPGRVLDAGRAAIGLVRDLLQARDATPLKSYGRARKLGGVAIALGPVREARVRLGCRTIDLLLTGIAGALGEWHRQSGHADARSLFTAVPVNLRAPEDQGLNSQVGNDVTAMLMHLPIGERDARRRLDRVRRLTARKRGDPAVGALPVFASVLSILPRPLHKLASLATGGLVDLIVTNVPGIPFARFVAGAEIQAAYPIAPVMPHCPLSIALYGYRDHLYIGLDADGTAVAELDTVCSMLERSFGEVAALPAVAA